MTKISKILVWIFVALILSLINADADVNQISISSCGSLTKANYTYVLTTDISSSGSTCFTIKANNITLEGNGYTANYSSISTGYGIVDTGNYSSAKIRNLTLAQKNSSVKNSHGIYFKNVFNNKITNVNITTQGMNSDGIYLSLSNSNEFSNINIFTKGVGADGIYLYSANLNSIYARSIISLYGNDYYLRNSTIDSFINTNFTTRKIYIYDNISTFNYSNGNGIWVNTTKLSTTIVITRSLINWNATNVSWLETTSGNKRLSYSLRGLIPNTNYSIWSDTVVAYNLKTDDDGNLPVFDISLSSTPKIIKVLPSVTECNFYDPVKNILSIVCDRHFAELAAEVNDPSKIAYLGNGEWMLNTTIFNANGTTFSINRTIDNVAWLKITGTNGLINNGRLDIDGIKITSWDPINEIPIGQIKGKDAIIPRGYIYFKASTGTIKNSDIGYLGYSELYRTGINLMHYSHDVLIYNNKIHDNYYATYTNTSTNVTIDGNEYYNNTFYAIDPHTNSYNFKITNNHVHHNYKTGIIFSVKCGNFLVENNTVHDNGGDKTGIGYGIVFSRISDNNIVRNNTVYNEYIGIDISQSSQNLIYDNKVSDSYIGMRLLSGIEGRSTDNLIYGNEIKNVNYGIFSRDATGNRIANITFLGDIGTNYYLEYDSVLQVENQRFTNATVSGLIGNNILTIVNSGKINASTLIMRDITMSYEFSTYSSRQINAEYVTESSILVGKQIGSISIRLVKIGSPTGEVQIGVFNPDLSVEKLFGTIDATDLSFSYKDYIFTLPIGTLYQIQPGDTIGIKFSGGDKNNYVGIMTDQDSGDPFDGMKSYYTQYKTSWVDFPTDDLYMTLKLNDVSIYDTDNTPVNFNLTSNNLEIDSVD